MGCLLALLAGFAPRVALALVWIFTNLVDRAFNGFLIPLLGLIVFPMRPCSTSLPIARLAAEWAVGDGSLWSSALSSTSGTGSAEV
jgi:hypothetical protein